jgi:ectoine hydroxylase-related dioxygenase (phytanoyl-CoA dioxygenase family)
MGETDHEVTAWLALSPATEASGCMRFAPGPHNQAFVANT